MDICALSERAEFINNERQRLLKQWGRYCNTLTQGISLLEAKFYQTISFTSDDELRFVLFDYFVIHIRLAEGFNNHTIEYVLEQRDGGNNIPIASAIMDNEGRIDSYIDNNNREHVLEHYLGLVHPVYDSLYQAIYVSWHSYSIASQEGNEQLPVKNNIAH